MGGVWYQDGVASGCDRLGRDGSGSYTLGLRFPADSLVQGGTVKFARLRLSARGGTCTSCATLVIRGIAEDSPQTFSPTRRPSDLPKTAASIEWNVEDAWPSPGGVPAFYVSGPNIADIINELLARPGWGTGGKWIALALEDNGCPPGEVNCLNVEDFLEPEVSSPALLETYPTLSSAFVAKPLLGRPTATSVALNVVNLLPIDIYAEYGEASGSYSYSTAPVLNLPGGQALDIDIGGLQPNTAYYYRVRFKEPGGQTYLSGPEGRFCTQRPSGSCFTFDITSDSHLYLGANGGSGPILGGAEWELYARTLGNVRGDTADFLIDLGDYVDMEAEGYARNAITFEEACDRYVERRGRTGGIADLPPFYLALGNHEAEQGWRTASGDDLEMWATEARKRVIPNPAPGEFYSGNEDTTAGCGFREDYYAWEWGDALFVVLDPFWYTTKAPHWYTEYPRQGDGWEWTLGEQQYNWLYDTLSNSSAKWKLVFAHHETGGVLKDYSFYGRGGIEAAKYAVSARPSFEWGGEGGTGDYLFPTERPGWEHGPIHDMMVATGVNAFFHGHDHVFAFQSLDGIAYVECPRPVDFTYSDGFYDAGFYGEGTEGNNSGHIRVTVGADDLQIEYVRAVLPQDEPLAEGGRTVYNEDVTFAYSFATAGVAGPSPAHRFPHLTGASPNPFLSATDLSFSVPLRRHIRLEVFDARGRIVATPADGDFESGLHRVTWDGLTGNGERAASGMYFCRLSAAAYSETRKIVMLR